mgnify:CR=1 FL=1
MLRKEEIRQQIKRRKRQFTEEQLRELSLAIIDRLLDHPRIKKAKRILMYYSLPDEVYTHEAIIQLVNEGKEVFLPVVLDNFEMELHKFSRKDNMSEGAFNIMEPIGHKYTNFDSIDVAQKRTSNRKKVIFVAGKKNRNGRKNRRCSHSGNRI